MWATFCGKHLSWIIWTPHQSQAVLDVCPRSMTEFFKWRRKLRNHWQAICHLHALNGGLCLQSLELVSSILPALLFHYLLSSSLLFCLYHRAFEYAFLTAWNSPSCLFPKLIKFASSSISVQTSLLQVELSLLLDEVKLFPIERSHGNL